METHKKNKELKDWLEDQRNSALGKMGYNADNPILKKMYEAVADAYMSVIIHMAVNAKNN